MKFMIVTDTFPPDINGVARTLHKLAHGLAKRGHSISVLTTAEEEGNTHQAISVKCMRAVAFPGYADVRLGLPTKSEMRLEIQKNQPDAMYVAVETPMGVNAIGAAREVGVGVVSGFHTNFHTYASDYRVPILGKAMATYLRWVHNRTSRTLTPSEGMAVQLRDMGIHNVGVLGRGVDSELFRPSRRDPALRAEWGATENTPVALFVSRIAAEKNLPLAVRAFQRMKEIRPETRCVFVGDGPKLSWLKEQHPEFIYAGARTGPDLGRHFASADVFVFPSLTETFGNVVTEALASGLVTISFNYAAAQQFVRNGENGFVAAFGDQADFIKGAETALEHWNDKAIRNAAFSSGSALSWDAIIEQFERELIDSQIAISS
jgi:glycosyltransferase involved in cell wall biosynthesis